MRRALAVTCVLSLAAGSATGQTAHPDSFLVRVAPATAAGTVELRFVATDGCLLGSRVDAVSCLADSTPVGRWRRYRDMPAGSLLPEDFTLALAPVLGQILEERDVSLLAREFAERNPPLLELSCGPLRWQVVWSRTYGLLQWPDVRTFLRALWPDSGGA